MAIHIGNPDFEGTVMIIADTEDEVTGIDTSVRRPGDVCIVAADGLPTYVLNASGEFVKVG